MKLPKEFKLDSRSKKEAFKRFGLTSKSIHREIKLQNQS